MKFLYLCFHFKMENICRMIKKSIPFYESKVREIISRLKNQAYEIERTLCLIGIFSKKLFLKETKIYRTEAINQIMELYINNNILKNKDDIIRKYLDNQLRIFIFLIIQE